MVVKDYIYNPCIVRNTVATAKRVVLNFSYEESEMIEDLAKKFGENPTHICKTIIMAKLVEKFG